MQRPRLAFDKIFSHIDGAGDEDDKTLDDILHIGINAKEGQPHEYQAEQHDAEYNAADLARSANEGNAADDARGDGIKLIIETRCRTI